MGFCAYASRSILSFGLSLSTFVLAAASQDRQQVQAAPSQPATAYKLQVKKGSRDDIEAIGKRKIVHLDFYSIDKEIRLGQKNVEQVEQKIKLLQDPGVTEYINRIGQNLVRNSDATVPVTIKVVDSDEASAFSLPGGYVYINSGLILDCEGEAELAGVMSHVIAHVAARHAMRLMLDEMLADILSKPLVRTTISDPPGKGGAAIAVPLTLLKFRHAFEMEADYFGVQYLYKSGYDPMAFVERLERDDQRQQVKPSPLPVNFSAQPPLAERIATAKKEIARILLPNDHLTVNTPEFDSIKAKLAERKNQSQEDKQAPK